MGYSKGALSVSSLKDGDLSEMTLFFEQGVEEGYTLLRIPLTLDAKERVFKRGGPPLKK